MVNLPVLNPSPLQNGRFFSRPFADSRLDNFGSDGGGYLNHFYPITRAATHFNEMRDFAFTPFFVRLNFRESSKCTHLRIFEGRTSQTSTLNFQIGYGRPYQGQNGQLFT